MYPKTFMREGGQAKSKVTKGQEIEEMKTTSTEMKRQQWHVRQWQIKKRLEGWEIMSKKKRKRRGEIRNNDKDERLKVKVKVQLDAAWNLDPNAISHGCHLLKKLKRVSPHGLDRNRLENMNPVHRRHTKTTVKTERQRLETGCLGIVYSHLTTQLSMKCIKKTQSSHQCSQSVSSGSSKRKQGVGVVSYPSPSKWIKVSLHRGRTRPTVQQLGGRATC